MPTTQPHPLQSGGLLQSGIPREMDEPPRDYHGTVRAVVLRTYVLDDPNHPIRSSGRAPFAVYCDLLAYGTFGSSRFYTLPGAMVTQPLGGVHGGAVYLPKAATRMLDGTPLSDVSAPDVSRMDGDHVLVSFVEGNRNQPVVVGALPHPSRDVGNSPLLPAGQRQGLRLVDGDPSLMKHHGTFYGVSDAGDFVADATLGNDGTMRPDGGEAASGTGSVRMRTAAGGARDTRVQDPSVPGAVVDLLVESLSASGYVLDARALSLAFSLVSLAGNGLAVVNGGAAASMKLGDGASPVALADAMASWWNSQVRPWLSDHVHPSAVGLTGPPSSPPPPYDGRITSGSLTVPSRPA